MVTNNDIRNFLGLRKSNREFEIKQVDALGINKNTLMFINKPIVCDFSVDSEDCVYLLEEVYADFYMSSKNEYIAVKNAKFKFCQLVDHFRLSSAFLKDFFLNHKDELKNPMLEEHYKCRAIIVGNNCHFDKGVIIGGTDFSPVMTDTPGVLTQFPQMGGVKIGNNVVIKYNSMIGRGTFGFTEIGDYTMIDYGCQVGHNCKIGNACIIAAGTIIGGSTTIGDNTVIGIGAKIRNGLHIGKNVSIGMGSVVIKDIPDNCVVVGNPARIINHKPIFDEGGLV